jgi:hypothetical protein
MSPQHKQTKLCLACFPRSADMSPPIDSSLLEWYLVGEEVTFAEFCHWYHDKVGNNANSPPLDET